MKKQITLLFALSVAIMLNANNINVTNIKVTGQNTTAGVNNSYTPSASVAGTLHYYCVVKGTCGMATSDVSGDFITLAVGGTIAGSAEVTSGTNSTTLTLSGNTGTVQWQSSADNINFTDISGATALTYTANNLTMTTYYRVVVTNGICIAHSKTAKITVGAMTGAGDYALNFDGSNDYVNIPYKSSFDFTTGTIEAWIAPGASTQNKCFLSMRTSSSVIRWSAHVNQNSGRIGVANIGYFNSVAVGTITPGTWMHVAIQLGTTSSTIYVNGVNKGTITNGISTVYTGLPLYIGLNDAGWPLEYFLGRIDEVRMWDVTRTEAEIKANMYKEIGTNANLVAYYRMSDGTGTFLSDNSENGNTGTLTNGPEWKLSGCFAGSRQALDFDGTNEYISIPHHASLNMGTGSFTFEYWVNKTNSNVRYDIINKENVNTYNDLSIAIMETNKAVFFTKGTTNQHLVASTQTIPAGVWTHIAGVRDGNVLKVYVNGVLDNTSTGTAQDLNNTNVMLLAANYNHTIAYEGFLNGKLDEVRIWNTARTESELRENMVRTLVGNESGLVAYYRFDHYDGTILYDITSNANKGTLTNMDPATDWVASTAFNTWLGGESNAWSTAANWSNGVPSSAQSVGIYNWSSSLPNVTTYLPVLPTTVSVNNLLVPMGVSTAGNVNLTATGSVFMGSNMTLSSSALNTAGNLEIESGKILTIPAGSQLTVSGTTTNSAGNSGLVIQSGSGGTGSFIHNSASVAATVQTYITGSSAITDKKYHFVSIPTQYASPTSNLFLGSYLYKLDPTQTFATNNYGKWIALGTSTTTELQTKQGYMIYYPNTATTYTFEGNLNNGTYNYLLTGHSGAGVYTFNLIPNPYPSAVVWNTGGTGWTESAGVGGTCYLWNASTGNYTSLASANDAYIPTGQALMVLVTNESSPTLSVNNNARIHSSQAFYKSASEIENQLVIKASSNNYTDETVVRFTTEASEEFDLQTDGMKLFGLEEAPQLFTLSGNEKYSINNLPVFQDQRTVDMSFETQFTGQVTLNFKGMESFEPSLNIYLKDELTNQTINLRNQQVYTFIHNPENAANRFKLIFGGTIGIEETASLSGNLWISGNTLYINTPNLTGQSGLVEVYNASGQKLMSKTIALIEVSAIELNCEGFVVARLMAGGEVITVKGVLRK